MLFSHLFLHSGHKAFLFIFIHLSKQVVPKTCLQSVKIHVSLVWFERQMEHSISIFSCLDKISMITLLICFFFGLEIVKEFIGRMDVNDYSNY